MHLKIQEFDDWKVKGLWIVSITSQQNGNGNPAHRYEYTCKEEIYSTEGNFDFIARYYIKK